MTGHRVVQQAALLLQCALSCVSIWVAERIGIDVNTGAALQKLGRDFARHQSCSEQQQRFEPNL